MSIDDERILNEFWRTLRKNSLDNVVDLDHNFQHKFGFSVQRFEDVLKGTDRIVPPNRWSYHRIGLIKKGSGEFRTGIYNFKAPAHTLVVVPARVITSSRNWSADIETYIAIFNNDFFLENNFPSRYAENRKILNGSYPPYIYLTAEQSERVSQIFEDILKNRTVDDTVKKELVALKLVELVLVTEQLFSEQFPFTEDQRPVDIFKKFSDLVEQYFKEERSVKFYAEKLHMHPNYLNTLIKKHSGVTAKASIQNRLLLESKYLLHSTSLSIKEIAQDIGFDDPNYFVAFFTQLENISPGAYRSQFV
jgi:AraC family transcriptional regulator, transcriptional activator of pobA